MATSWRKALHLSPFFLTLLVVILASCAPSTTNQIKPPLPYGIKRFVDTEAGVVCWAYAYNGGAGLSCIPLNHTLYGEWREQK